MKKIFCVVALFSFLFLACDRKIAAVGSIDITKKDISLRTKISEVYYPDSKKEYVGLTQLIKGFLSVEVLKSLGQKVDGDAIEREDKRIDVDTKDPDKLKKIKEIFGSNKREYFKVFIMPVYGERVLYNDIFLKSSSVHKNENEKALKFLNEAIKSPASFVSLAKKRNLRAVKLSVSSENGIINLDDGRGARGKKGEGIEQAQRMISMLGKVKEGYVCSDLIEWQEGYQVVKLLKKTKGDYLIESVTIPKMSFDDWFWPLAKKIPVKIYDSDLREQFIKEVSWSRNLNLE